MVRKERFVRNPKPSATSFTDLKHFETICALPSFGQCQ
jgi:hypothetical protein